MNSLILSLLYKATPDEVRLIMIDPKMVELGIYNGIPHLFIPVVTDPKKAAGALQWAVVEMMKRYRLFSEAGVRDIGGYNDFQKRTGGETIPQVVIVIDELADLMLVAPRRLRRAIAGGPDGRASRLAPIIALSALRGRHNGPRRPTYHAHSFRGVLRDGKPHHTRPQGAKSWGLRGHVYSRGSGKTVRIQGAFVTDEEREESSTS
jgi:DNA segregation ATPase FtsK/SpoIIIE-like protein